MRNQGRIHVSNTTAVHRAAQVARRQRTTVILRAPVLPPFHRQILQTADLYRSKGENEIAVIMAQTACELVTESAFDVLFRAVGVSAKDQEQLRQTTYNLGNKRTAAVYRLLAKDRVQGQPFWRDFKAHADLRHAIVHKGAKATAHDADRSVSAATDFIAHIEAVIAAASASP